MIIELTKDALPSVSLCVQRTAGELKRLGANRGASICPGRTGSATMRSIMVSSRTEAHDPSELGELEQAVLETVWRSRNLTADEVRQQLTTAGRLLKESTVRTVLRRLEEKGYLTHTLEQRTFRYRAAEDGASVAGRAVQRIVDRFCGGSVESLLLGMVSAEVLSESELKRLAEKIARKRQEAEETKVAQQNRRTGL